MSLIPTATDWKAKLHRPISSPNFSEMASKNVEYNEENKSAEKWTTDCAVSRWCCHLGYCWYAVIRPRVIKPWNASSHAVAFVKPPGRHHPILILEKLCNCPIHLRSIKLHPATHVIIEEYWLSFTSTYIFEGFHSPGHPSPCLLCFRCSKWTCTARESPHNFVRHSSYSWKMLEN